MHNTQDGIATYFIRIAFRRDWNLTFERIKYGITCDKWILSARWKKQWANLWCGRCINRMLKSSIQKWHYKQLMPRHFAATERCGTGNAHDLAICMSPLETICGFSFRFIVYFRGFSLFSLLISFIASLQSLELSHGFSNTYSGFYFQNKLYQV